MNTVNIKSVKIEGFRSFVEPAIFSFDRPGVNMIKGKNGSGKTTLLESIVWSLYGENLKGTTKDKLISKKQYRAPNFKGTRVVLILEVNTENYMIARHIKFKQETLGFRGDDKLMLFEEKTEGDWTLRAEDLYNGDIQSHITNLIGLDFNTFMNSIVFGQRMKRLVESKPTEKRELFETLFDLDFVEKARLKAKAKKEEATNKYNKVLAGHTILENNLSSYLVQLDRDKLLLANFESDREATLKTYQDKLDLCNSIINEKQKNIETFSTKLAKNIAYIENEINPFLAEKDDLQIALAKLNNHLDTQLQDQNKLSRELSSISNNSVQQSSITKSENILVNLKDDLKNVSTTCPTCNGPLPSSDIDNAKSSIKQQIQREKEALKNLQSTLEKDREAILDIQEAQQNLQTDIDSTNDDINDLTSKISKFDSYTQARKKLQDENQDLQNEIKLFDTDINHQKSTITTYNDLITSEKNKVLDIDLDAIEQSIETTKTELDDNVSKQTLLTEIIDKINWWVTKGFGSSGLKSYVFFAMLNQLNESILKYCNRLGVLVQFSVDMDKASKPFITKCYKADGTEISYLELSGGEKARIDVATAFAVYDLISDSKTTFNVMFLDEFFEGLDEEGLYESFDLLRLIATSGKSVFVITHMVNADLLNTKVVEVVKNQGVSEIL